MKELINLLESYAQNETMVQRNEYVDTIEELNAYNRGKADGFAYMARQVLKRLEKINKKKQDLGFGKVGFYE